MYIIGIATCAFLSCTISGEAKICDVASTIFLISVILEHFFTLLER